MNEIIEIKKDIIFKTTIHEIKEINLEHNFKIEDDIITGNIYLNGCYKMTEASVIDEDFMYTIPFSISISKRVNKDTINVEIDDFKYEIFKDILKVNVSLCLTCEEIEEMSSYIDEFIKEDIIDIPEEKEVEEPKNDSIDYYTYKIYIIKENDTIESITKKYNISIKELNEYNDLNNFNIGEKLLIPQINDI